ncbi:MAG: hypothetical protein A2Y77_15840 [Planctomycetes bacterium RBG_13_62_9]|nr:MAG: hypothetical protein A2Y77_15840 [Planctomycetes bacterium RBG_13_62_9]
MGMEEKYLDVLQNIEYTIVATYHRHADMTDYEVIRVLEAVIDGYKAETLGRPPREYAPQDMEAELYQAVRDVCQWRLGRAEAPPAGTKRAGPAPQPVTVETMILCLKQILRSVVKSNRSGGRTGYLDFIVQYIR